VNLECLLGDPLTTVRNLLLCRFDPDPVDPRAQLLELLGDLLALPFEVVAGGEFVVDVPKLCLDLLDPLRRAVALDFELTHFRLQLEEFVLLWPLAGLDVRFEVCDPLGQFVPSLFEPFDGRLPRFDFLCHLLATGFEVLSLFVRRLEGLEVLGKVGNLGFELVSLRALLLPECPELVDYLLDPPLVDLAPAGPAGDRPADGQRHGPAVGVAFQRHEISAKRARDHRTGNRRLRRDDHG